ncbi:CYTH domain-containing protein [Salmonella enterica subsp. enterica]|nr:CYTH domain-containing protein [Salmonella enterica subsp. enterica]
MLNIYFETPDNWLRRHDMGLRVFVVKNGRYEMTMKENCRPGNGRALQRRIQCRAKRTRAGSDATSGGGLADGNLPAGTASSVQPLFSTDFTGKKWCRTLTAAGLKIALDLGAT